MIVLLIFGIVSAVAIPSIRRSLDEIKLDGAAREVVSMLFYCQSLAIKKGKNQIVQFHHGQDRFWCFEQASGLKAVHPLDKKEYHIKFQTEGPFQGVDIINAGFGPANKSSVVFSSLGEPDFVGSVVVGYGGLQKTITVSGILGNIAVN